MANDLGLLNIDTVEVHTADQIGEGRLSKTSLR